LARHDWMNNYINLDQYKSRVLTGMFLILAADATPEFRQRLMVQIQTVNLRG